MKTYLHVLYVAELFLARHMFQAEGGEFVYRHHEVLGHTINQLFTSAQHLLLLIIGLHVSTDHSVIFRSLMCCKFQGAVHTFGIPIAFTLKLNPFISVGG